MTEPTDAEIIAVMRDGYNCRYNDEQDHVDFARAVLEKWGNPAVAGEPVGWMWQHDETGRTGFVDCWQVENGWQKGNPRLRFISKLYATPQPTQAQVGAVPLTDEQIDAVAESMPGGLAGFLKGWGWRQFAREILTLRRMPDWEPQFDCMAPKQEELAIQFCQEIAGPRGKRGSPPDPVRLLEMAEALYKAEREHHNGIKGGQHGTE